MAAVVNFRFLSKEGGGGGMNHSSRGYGRGGGGGEPRGRGGGGARGRGGERSSIGGICSSIPTAVTGIIRIASSISLSELRISVRVYPTILS